MQISPSRWLKGFAAFTHAALWVLLAAWLVLVLAWGALHFLIVPRIGEFRPWLEQQASQSLGIRVRIGQITARSNGLIPSVELRDVELIDASGSASLRLPSVLAALSPRSALGLRFEQLYLEGPDLLVRRTADGRIWIAGFALPQDADDSRSSDWLFSQTEVVVRHGKVRWSDELRGLPVLALDDVDVVLRNKGRSHALRLDADPPAGWGERWTLQAEFQHALLSLRKGDWRRWRGQVFVQAPQLDLAQLRDYVDWAADLRQGAGSARVWLDVEQGKLVGATADVALTAVTLSLAKDLQALELDRVSGRLEVRVLDAGYELATRALAFDTRDGLHWPGGNLQLGLFRAQAAQAAHGSLRADRLDLAAVSAVASRLPLHAPLREALQRLAPQGLLQNLQLRWQGAATAPQTYAAQGRVSGLQLRAQPHTQTQGDPGIPGLRGVSVDFDFNQSAGKASVVSKNGTFEFPGLLENPRVTLADLRGDLRWTVDGPRIAVKADKLRFANDDAQGEVQLAWQTAPVPAGGSADLRFPGVLDVQGSVSRLSLAALPRYLPLSLNTDVRSYLSQALLAGQGRNARFKLKGNLAQFPFASARQGTLQMTGDIENASFAYAPALVLAPESAAWPVLTQLSGSLRLDHDTLQLESARGLLVAGTQLRLSSAQATLSKLYSAPVLDISADARGPLVQALDFVNTTPIADWTGRALAQARVYGTADYSIKLNLPLDHLDRSTVQGSIALSNNDFQFSPLVPGLSRLKGLVTFSDTGFVLNAVQGHALGADLRLDGGLDFAQGPAPGAPRSLRVQGVASAEGLSQTPELGLLARLARFSTGATAYTAELGVRQGQPELLVTSSLAGLALNLPGPFTKSAERPLPLRLEGVLLPGTADARLQDQWQLSLGPLASATFVRAIGGTQAQVLRGAIAVGLSADEAAALPDSGVSANVKVAQMDVDAWKAVVSTVLGMPAGGSIASLGDSSESGYLPSSVALRAGELWLDGRKFNQLLLGGVRDGPTWRANVESDEMSGYLEYRQSKGDVPGRVMARLARLTLGPAVAQDVENMLDQQPASIPALDIVVDDLELRGRKLGRVDIQAVNRGSDGARDAQREWRLNRFNITLPEAKLVASGNWVNVNAQASAAESSLRERRRTVLNFELDVLDSGALLTRMGMPGVIAQGKGKVDGQVSWLGSPLSPDYPSMSGGFRLDMESGQFLKADPGIAKLLGVLSLQSLPRRLTLDFRDVFSDGFSFDYVRGDATIAHGIAQTSNLQMKGVNAAVMMQGTADIAQETQRLKVVVVPEINVASASLLYSAINPAVALTTFLANLLLRGPLVSANTQEFLIDGTWVDPRVTQVDRKAVPAAPAAQ